MKLHYLYSGLLLAAICVCSCEKEPGEGGNSFIRGKVQVVTRLVAGNPATSLDTLPAADREVYIVSGDDITVDERIRTDYNGEFEFPYLRKGDYTVYLYSDDTTGTVNQESDAFHLMPVVVKVEITEKKQTIEIPVITIYEDV